MRIDKFLKNSRIIKRRTVANEACDAGRVLINDKVAKASANVAVGDIIEIGFGTRSVKVEVLDIQETTKKDEAKDLFKYLSYTYQDKFSATIGFDGALANQIYAGCDFFLMPSKSEPCGLSQLISMRYGTIPIVRETGGLFDTVPALNIETLEGRGFTFKLFNANDMHYAINRAADFYYDKEKLKAVITKLMKEDFSWKQPAREYLDLYNEITA